jgi:hypothetical protein
LELERKREDNRQTQNNKNYGEQLATQWRGRTTKLTITKGQDVNYQLDNMIPLTGNISIVTMMLPFTKI